LIQPVKSTGARYSSNRAARSSTRTPWTGIWRDRPAIRCIAMFHGSRVASNHRRLRGVEA
jgi:hypothetical protein